MLELTPDQRKRKREIISALRSTAIPISCQIIQNAKSLEIRTNTGQNIYKANISGGEFGKINNFVERGWFEHDGIDHQIGTRLLESPFGQFCLNYWGEEKLESHNKAGEIITNAVQKFFDPTWDGTYVTRDIESNAKVQALILIVQTWLERSILPKQKELFLEFRKLKVNQLERQLTREDKNPKKNLVIKLPKVKWLDNIRNAKFKMPSNREIKVFQKRYIRELSWSDTEDNKKVAEMIPELVKIVFHDFQNSEFYKS